MGKPLRALTLKQALGVLFLCIVGVLALIAIWPGSEPQPTKATPTVSSQPAPANDDRPLSKEETVQALSDYVGNLQALFFTSSVMSRLHIAKIGQDARFLNLDRMDADAEALMENAKQLQAAVDSAAVPTNISDAAATQFEGVQEAASNLAAEVVSLTADFAVFAHTGLTDDEANRKDIAAVKRARREFEAAVYRAYQAFGVPKSRIDPSSLSLKL